MSFKSQIRSNSNSSPADRYSGWRYAFQNDGGRRTKTLRSIENVHIFHTARVADQNLHIVASGLVAAAANGERIRELSVGDSEHFQIRIHITFISNSLNSIIPTVNEHPAVNLRHIYQFVLCIFECLSAAQLAISNTVRVIHHLDDFGLITCVSGGG